MTSDEPIGVPAGLTAVAGRGEPWASWIAGLPRLASEVLAEWEAMPGTMDPYPEEEPPKDLPG